MSTTQLLRAVGAAGVGIAGLVSTDNQKQGGHTQEDYNKATNAVTSYRQLIGRA